MWAVAIPLAFYTRWIYATAFISVLSIYALYQNADQKVEQLRQKREGKDVG